MNIVQIQSRVQELPNSPQTMQYLNAAMNGQVTTVPPYIAAAELKRRETEGMMDQLAQGAAKAPTSTVKDQLQQKIGIMALMGQRQPPQQPQIPQPAPPEQQPQAGGIDSLPIRGDMFTAAGGGIVAFSGETGSVVPEAQPERLPGESLEAYRQRLIAIREVYAQQQNERRKTQTPDDRRRAFAEAEAAQQRGIAERGSPSMPRAISPAPAAPAFEGPGAKERLSPGDMALRQQSVNAQPLAPPPSQKPSGPRLPAAAKPPAEAGISIADQAPGLNLEDALGATEEYRRMKQIAGANNPYSGTQESQEDYIKRVRQGILSQIPGGKTPYETSEARLKEIEARRAKEDTEYADSNKGRQLDNLLTFISGMGRGSFGNAGAQGIEAVQKVKRSQREEDLKRKDLRDQQSMRLMEIRSLNDQAQYAEATGNVKEFERLKQEIKKLENEYAFKQADINKDVATLGSTARTKDVDVAENRKKLTEESRQKQLERDKDVKVAGIYTASRAEGRGKMTEAQAAKLRADAERALDKYLEKAPFKERQAAKDPNVRERMLQERMDTIFQSGQGYTSGSPSSAPGGGAAPAGFTVQRDPK